MIISYELAIVINEILFNSGKRPRMKVYEQQFQIFTEEELASITEITINNFSSLDDLIYLPNLKVLKIISLNYNDMIPEVDLDSSLDINHITDFSSISNLKNLEELYIENDINIKSLDVTNLKALRKLIITNNANLKELIGLDTLRKLDEVFICGNSIDSPLDYERYCSNTIMASSNILDISMYLPIINRSRNGAKRLVDLEIMGASNVVFAEKSGFLEYSVINARSLYDMFIKLDVFFRKNKAYDLSYIEKCAFVYKYIMHNIAFSEESIIRRDDTYAHLLRHYRAIPSQYRQSLASIHNSYYAYHFKNANCEGIVNLTVFMLRMLGIEAANVHCHDLRDCKNFGNNHAIVRTEDNGQVSYTDPTFGRKERLSLFMLNYSDISMFHRLDAYENLLSNKNSQEKEISYVKKNFEC